MSAWRRPERGRKAWRKPPRRQRQSAERNAEGKSSWSFVTAKRSMRRYDARQPATRCAAWSNFVWQAGGAYCGAERARLRRCRLIRQPKPPPSLLHLQMAQSHCQGIRGVRRLRCFVHRKQGTHHQLHLLLAGVAVTGDARLHFARRVAVDQYSMLCRGKQDHAAHFRKPERRAHIQGGEHALDGQGIRRKLLNQAAHPSVHILKCCARTFLLALRRY